MGIHQNIQDKVIEELDNIFGDSDRPATFQDTLEMKYLERCLMETLRMYPPVPVIARELKQDVRLSNSHFLCLHTQQCFRISSTVYWFIFLSESKNIVIPGGCTVVIGTYKVHRRDDIYPNPNVFNPDNFLPENCANRHYYAFVPFSAGPRSCVGKFCNITILD